MKARFTGSSGWNPGPMPPNWEAWSRLSNARSGLLARGAEVDEIVNVAAIAVVDAQETELFGRKPEFTKAVMADQLLTISE